MAKTARKMPPKPTQESAPVVHQDLSVTTEQVQAVAEQAQANRKGRKSRSELYANYKPVLTDMITLVPGGKAKKANSKAAAKFALYGTGNVTVGEVLTAAKTAKIKPSIRWDWAHNLIEINGQKAPVA